MKKLKYVLFLFIMFIVSIKGVSAEIDLYSYEGYGCIHANGILRYVCEVVNGNIECNLGCASGSPCQSYFNVDNVSVVLKNEDFLKNGSFVCAEKLYACHDTDDKTDKTVINKVDKKQIDCGKKGGSELSYAPKATNFDGEKYIKVSTVDLEKENNKEPQPTVPTEPPKSDSDDDTDWDNICTIPAVQGVFTTLGWVFFILKIVVPIILIIFGSIDFAKAVAASKDDEIKKSTKKLVMRAIAGVVIFFIPTILNFVVSVIDDDNVYNGDFWDCSKCLTDPGNENCSSLGGN